ncbi:hypothetical protein SAMN05661096_03909 [Marivirga sericea]|uniref:Uncharacterized protein n=1 Tax=Marivirga sericea TaxID=1028 RepID=A0A1X7LEN7_9BACT|nr:hypothetical protein [Marivirga sericea]SMG52298.1 hypothetical protein SAMN05661096_03909 [Marivirga sericea]
MKFKKLDITSIIAKYPSVLTTKGTYDSERIFQFRSLNDCSVLNDYLLNGKFAYHYFPFKLVLTDLKQKHIYVLFDEKKIYREEGEFYLISKMKENVLRYSPSEKVYVSEISGSEIFRYQKPKLNELFFYKNFIIEAEMFHKKQNNWLKCIEPSTGNEKWRLDFEWQIVRCEAYQHLLILDYNHYELRTDKGYEDQMNWENPIKYTIAINAETGDEAWRHNFRYNTIDYENGLVLSGGHTAKSVDMATGKLTRDVTIIPEDLYGYRLRFSDEEGFYYIHHRGSFGKISKTSGNVLWEFDLLDEQGAKRKLTDWLLLGNGKLVLSTLPNHPNGDFTCIFDPEENMEYSNIIDGKRVKPLE